LESAGAITSLGAGVDHLLDDADLLAGIGFVLDAVGDQVEIVGWAFW
jgi:hypothetical protein